MLVKIVSFLKNHVSLHIRKVFFATLFAVLTALPYANADDSIRHIQIKNV